MHWLIDVRRRPTPTPALANWVAEHWLPQLAARLGPARPRLAYLISPTRYDALQRDPALRHSVDVAFRPEQPYDIAIFGDEGEAVRWLLA